MSTKTKFRMLRRKQIGVILTTTKEEVDGKEIEKQSSKRWIVNAGDVIDTQNLPKGAQLRADHLFQMVELKMAEHV